MDDAEAIRIIRPEDGEVLAEPDGTHDRIMIPAELTGARFALVEHRLAPRRLAAPLHRHTREDEYSFVLQGRIGACLGDEEVVVHAGSLLHKPRAQWHTFWNPDDTPALVLELISPGGFEQAFREMNSYEGELDLESMAALAARHGVEVDVDFERTAAVIARHGLEF